MLVGWRTPTDTNMFPPALQKAIKNTHLVLMLDLVDYQIDFANDGSVKLKIQYMGSIENAYRSPAGDIMRITEESPAEKARRAEIEKHQENIKKLEGTKEKWVDDRVRAVAQNTGGQLQKSTTELKVMYEKELKDKVTAQKQAIADKQANSVAHTTQQFFRSMGKSTLYFFDVTDEEVSIVNEAITTMGKKRSKNKHLKDIDQGLDTKVKEIYRSIGFGGRISAVEQINAQAASEEAVQDNRESIEHQKQGLKVTTEGSITKRHLNRLQAKKWEYGLDSNNGRNFRRIAFIKLGDVIDNLLGKVTKNVAKEMKMKNLTILLGPLRFKDLISNQTKFLNIAELPIDIKVFNKFLTEKVIGEGRSSYFFQEFLEDLINELVYASLDSCRSTGVSTDAADLELLPFSAPSGPNGGGKILPGQRLSFAKFRHLRGAFPKASHTPVKNLQNYLLLYAARQSSDEEKGDYAQDVQNKIFHFVIGGPDSGLLKEVQFNKINNKTWARAVYQQTKGDDNITSGTIKPSIWSISITAIGNTLISIGSKIYIDSSFVDGGTSKFHKLSFGGYYVVHKVIHTYTEAKYETQIVAKMEKTDWVIDSEKKVDAVVKTVPTTPVKTSNAEVLK
jgi:predicted lactoylglutathione lyase